MMTMTFAYQYLQNIQIITIGQIYIHISNFAKVYILTSIPPAVIEFSALRNWDYPGMCWGFSKFSKKWQPSIYL